MMTLLSSTTRSPSTSTGILRMGDSLANSTRLRFSLGSSMRNVNGTAFS